MSAANSPVPVLRSVPEVLGFEWRRVGFTAGEVTRDPGSTKNGDGRFALSCETHECLADSASVQQRARSVCHIHEFTLACPWRR